MNACLASEALVVFDGKAVGLVLDPGNEPEGLGMRVYGQLLIPEIKASGPVAVVLYHAADTDGKPQLPEHLLCDVHLSLSAVHQQKIRKSGKGACKFRLLSSLGKLLKAVRKPPLQHLPHGGVIVGPLDGTDPELSVVAALGPAVLVHHHAAYGFKAVGVGDVIGLHPMQLRKPQEVSQLSHGPDGPKLLPLHLVTVPLQHDPGILHRHFHQLFLLALLGIADMHPAASCPGEPLLDEVTSLDGSLDPDLLRNIRGPGIKLLDEGQEDLRQGVLFIDIQMKALPADEPAVPDEKGLGHRILSCGIKTDDVPVVRVHGGDLLPGGDLRDGLQQIPVFRRLFKFQLFRSLLHLLRQVVPDVIVFSLQKFQGLVHLGPVLLLADEPGAGGVALVHVMIQAGPFLADVPGQHPAAGSDLE